MVGMKKQIKECIICNEDFYWSINEEKVCHYCMNDHVKTLNTEELAFPIDCCFTEEELGSLLKIYKREIHRK